MDNNLELEKIIFPSLDSVEYANSLSNAFDNINANFSILANREFVKGESGESFKVIEKPIFDGEALTEIGEKLKNCIMNLKDYTEKSIIFEDKEYTLWDNFIKDNAGSVYMIYKTKNDVSDNEPTSSLYYVFKDGRFSHNDIGSIGEEYTGITDLSCIVVYDADLDLGDGEKGGFKALTNSIATLYYEIDSGFCWKINGVKTGILAQGLTGKDGLDSKIYLIKCQTLTEENGRLVGEVTHVHNVDGFNLLSESHIDTEALNDKTAVVLASTTNKTNGSEFYFGTMYYDYHSNPKCLKVVIESDTSINALIDTVEIENYFKNIDIKGVNSDSKGIFIPITNEIEGVQPVHLMSSISITNSGADTDKNSDIILTPITDINSLTLESSIDNDNGENRLDVEKYLYLKVNNDSEIYEYLNAINEAYKNNKQDSNGYDVAEILNKYNYVLKYKLIQSVDYKTDEDIRDSQIFNEVEISNSNITGSRVFDYTWNTNYSNLPLIEGKYTPKYGTYSEESSEVLSEDHLTTIDGKFKGTTIYRWELCNIKNDFDIEGINDGYISNTSNEPLFELKENNPFLVVYTNTINPSVASDILWFNGVTLNSYEDENDELKYFSPGWTLPDTNIFDFIKFIPVYNNDFSYNGDTAINVNYNINVTGDDNSNTRNVTVNGDINVNNINAYNNVHVHADEDIYGNLNVKKDISTDNGIMLKHNGEEMFKVYVDEENGVDNTILSMKNGQFRGAIQFAENMEFDVLNANKLNIKQHVNFNATDIELTKTKNINIERNKGIYLSNGVQLPQNPLPGIQRANTANAILTKSHEPKSYAINDLPVINNNNSSISVSNVKDDLSNVCFVNNESYLTNKDDNKIIPGTGVTSKDYIDNVTCNTVKNFNMHRLSVVDSYTNIKNNIIGSTTTAFDNLESINNNPYDSKYKNDWIKSSKIDFEKEKTLEYKANDNISNDNINNYFAKYEFKRGSDTSKLLSNNDNITFETTNAIFKIGVYGKAYKINKDKILYPLLMDDSNISFSVFYEIYDKDLNKTEVLEIEDIKVLNNDMDLDYKLLPLKDISININYNNSKNYDATNKWMGYTSSNSFINTDDRSKKWRYYTFILPKMKYCIESNTDAFNAIKSAYNTGKEISVCVCPNFNIHIKSEKKNSRVNGIQRLVGSIAVSKLIPYYNANDGKNIYSYEDITNITANRYDKTGIFKNEIISNESLTIAYYDTLFSYNVRDIVRNNSNINVTTICQDGVVIRSNESVFGIGLVNKTKTTATPSVFYHKYDSNDYINPTTDTYSIDGYANRTKIIPLKYLVEMYEWWSTNHLDGEDIETVISNTIQNELEQVRHEFFTKIDNAVDNAVNIAIKNNNFVTKYDSFKSAFIDIDKNKMPKLYSILPGSVPTLIEISNASINGNVITLKTKNNTANISGINNENINSVKLYMEELYNSGGDKAYCFGISNIIKLNDNESISVSLINDSSNISINKSIINGIHVCKVTIENVKLTCSSDSQVYNVTINIESNNE